MKGKIFNHIKKVIIVALIIMTLMYLNMRESSKIGLKARLILQKKFMN